MDKKDLTELLEKFRNDIACDIKRTVEEDVVSSLNIAALFEVQNKKTEKLKRENSELRKIVSNIQLLICM